MSVVRQLARRRIWPTTWGPITNTNVMCVGRQLASRRIWPTTWGPITYTNVMCGEKYCHQNSLNMHKKIHIKEKLYKCDICGTRCVNQSALIGHVGTHTGEIPFKCDVCGKRFTQQSVLIRHRKTCTEREWNGWNTSLSVFINSPETDWSFIPFIWQHLWNILTLSFTLFGIQKILWYCLI